MYIIIRSAKIMFNDFIGYIIIFVKLLNWQPYLKGRIREIREYDWLKLFAYGICTERCLHRILDNHNDKKKL